MKFSGKFLLATISAAIALYAVVGGWLGTQAQQPINDAGAQIRIFESVLQYIQNDYVDEPDLAKVRAGALRGLAYGLDPYSSYLTADQVRDYQTKKNSTTVGVGAEFSQVSSYLYVISTIKNGPADKAGIKAGDVIEYIGTKATRDISLYDARQLVLGDAGSKVDFRVLRAGSGPQTISVTRASATVPSAEVKMEAGNIAVIKIYGLTSGQSSEIRSIVQDLIKKDVKKIVLDLRGVATGELAEAVEVANIFVKDGSLAEVIGRENKVVQSFSADPNKYMFGGEVAALIDLGTAGTGEVVAAAIIDRKRGEVIGERSFGAGTEQALFNLRDGDGFLLTIEKWASSSGQPFLGENRTDSGVKPTIEVKRPETPTPIEVEDLVDGQNDENNREVQPTPDVAKPANTGEDLQLKKALEVLQGRVAAKAAGA